MKVFIVVWIGRDGEAEFHGAWSNREAADNRAKLVANSDEWNLCGIHVIETVVDEAVQVNL